MAGKLEVWQRGPLEDIPVLVQPIAHALLQAREELYEMVKDFSENLLWERPAGVASPAFHLQHLAGVLDRLFTYARNEQLSPIQLEALRIEGNKEETTLTMKELLESFNKQVDSAINDLKKVNVEMLSEQRTVGRKKNPSTLIGLYTHAAEHTMRHIGQLLVTVKILKAK